MLRSTQTMRRRLPHVLVLVLASATAVAAACTPFGLGDETPAPPAEGPIATGDGGKVSDDVGGINETGKGAGSGAATGLPCDVQQLIENRCIACHLSSSTLPMLTYEDLQKPAPSDGTKSMLKMAVERMKSTDKPMPPPPALAPTAEEVAILEGWLKLNAPREEKNCTPPVVLDAGTAGPPVNYNTPVVCTSGKYWTSNNYYGGSMGPRAFGGGFGGSGGQQGGQGGYPNSNFKDDGSEFMNPGRACNTCHVQRGGPNYQVSGTVYPTAHEPDDCNGVNDANIVITDANGVVKKIGVNSAGNFFTSEPIAAPFRVTVTRGGKERPMASAVTIADCNSCHTTAGVNGAPGRVMAP